MLKLYNITKAVNKETVFTKTTETKIIQSFKPGIWQYWLTFIILAFSIFLAFTAFGINTITGLSILSISGLVIIYIILSVCTTEYVITNQGILVRKGPFSGKFKEINYGDINNVSIKQGSMQKRFKIGNLTIVTGGVSRVFKGIRNPYQIKELINKEKASAYERRTLLRKIL
ncbi:MAG: PH domain-containing protein [Candidatus Brocadiales bacterium]|nr:PH domain-containing protein [Candidatus Brocadiales bacterium]